MSFFEANIWKSHYLQGIASLLSSNPSIQTCFYIAEYGVVSKVRLPAKTATCSSPKKYMTWAILNKLKKRVDGLKETVITISDRSYIPCDVCEELTADDLNRLTPLDSIATTEYNKSYTRVAEANSKSANTKMITTILYLGFFMVCIVLLITLIKK